jgi:hypothetical protein
MRYIFSLLILTMSSNVYAVYNMSKIKTLKSHIGMYCSKNCVDPQDLITAVRFTADVVGVSETLLLAIIHTESNFNKKAVSKSNAVGLMQVIPRWHKDKLVPGMSHTNIFNNIIAGAIVYKNCLNKHNNSVRWALRCYSGYNDEINPNYSNKVLRNRNLILKLVEYDPKWQMVYYR